MERVCAVQQTPRPRCTRRPWLPRAHGGVWLSHAGAPHSSAGASAQPGHRQTPSVDSTAGGGLRHPPPALMWSPPGTPRVLPLPGTPPTVSTPCGGPCHRLPGSRRCPPDWDVLWARAQEPGDPRSLLQSLRLTEQRERQLSGAQGLLSHWVPWDTLRGEDAGRPAPKPPRAPVRARSPGCPRPETRSGPATGSAAHRLH